MKAMYYQVIEYNDENPEKKRLIYTFDNEPAANDMIELILKLDFLHPNIGIEEYETTT